MASEQQRAARRARLKDKKARQAQKDQAKREARTRAYAAELAHLARIEARYAREQEEENDRLLWQQAQEDAAAQDQQDPEGRPVNEMKADALARLGELLRRDGHALPTRVIEQAQGLTRAIDRLRSAPRPTQADEWKAKREQRQREQAARQQQQQADAARRKAARKASRDKARLARVAVLVASQRGKTQ